MGLNCGSQRAAVEDCSPICEHHTICTHKVVCCPGGAVVCARGHAGCCVCRSSSLRSLSPAPLAAFCPAGCRGQYDNGADATGSPPRPSGVYTHLAGWMQKATNFPGNRCRCRVEYGVKKTPLKIPPEESVLVINVLKREKGNRISVYCQNLNYTNLWILGPFSFDIQI